MRQFGACYFILAFIIFMVVLFIDLYTKDTHQYYSLKLSRHLEDNVPMLRYYFWIFSYPLYYCIPFFVISMLFFRSNKYEAFLGIFVIMLDSFTANTLKIILHDARPCFYSFKISQQFGCSCAFGDPSGHSSSTILFYFYLYNSFIKKQNGLNETAKNIGFILWIIIFLNVGFSRVFYGKHFFMQVLLGWSLGFINILIYYYTDKNQVFDLIMNLPVNKALELSKVSPNQKIQEKKIQDKKFKKENKRTYYIYTIFLIFQLIAFTATVMAVIIALQFEDNPYHPYSQPVCDEKCFQGERYLSYNSLRSTLMYQFFLFTLLIIKNRKTRVFFMNQKYYQQTLSLNNFLFVLQRFIIFLITMLPLGITFIVAKLMISAWVIIAVLLIIGVIQALFLTELFPYLLKKCNAHIKGDLFIGFED